MSLLKPIVENLAERLAAAHGGRVAAVQMLPYLPVSLKVISDCLKEMVDNQVVFEERNDGVDWFVFPELQGTDKRPLESGTCIYSGKRFSAKPGQVLHPEIHSALNRELADLAEENAWPAEAVWQHELVYLGTQEEGPSTIAQIAGRSRMTLKQVKERLRMLASRGHCHQVVTDRGEGFVFPSIDYSPDVFQANDRFIRQYPASLRDEWEAKVTQLLVSLIAIVAVCFVLALGLRIPFPLLLLVGALAGVLVAVRIFTRRTRVPTPSN